MSKLPAGHDQQSLYVVARSVLLDALIALQAHRDAVVLIGAQAVYVHTQHAELGFTAYTSDGDLGIDPVLLEDEPLLENAMTGAGFTKVGGNRQPQPGIWWKAANVDGRPADIAVDLLVPHSLTDGGRRSAEIPPHNREAVHRVPGIEVAMEDHAPHVIGALDPADSRRVEIEVAGVAALLVAKAYKISERLEQSARTPGRLSNKDAADVLGLMLSSDVFDVSETFDQLLNSERVGEVTTLGLRHLHRLFGTERARGVEMAIQALGQMNSDRIRRITTGYADQLPRP